MKNPLLVNFLNVALGLQELPYSGIRVKDATLIATDGFSLVAYRTSPIFLRGEGMLHPLTVQALAVYANAVIEGITVDGNAVSLTVYFDYPRSEIFNLPPFPCEVKYTEKIFDKLTNAVIVAEQLAAKFILPPNAGRFVKIADAGLVSATDDDYPRYDAKRVKQCAKLFRAKDFVTLSVTEEGYMSVADEWGQLVVVSPIVRNPYYRGS
jgi:hypothetical protein